MPIEITMPSLAAGMTEGNLSRWLKAENEPVEKGEAIAEVETDKATMEIEAEDSGILARILVPSGSEGVPVNTPIALLLQRGESADVLLQSPVTGSAAMTSGPTELPDTESTEDAGTVPPLTAERVEPGPMASANAARLHASPLARRLAVEYGVALASLEGSGPGGRIVRLDVERAREQRPPATAAKSPPASSPSATPTPTPRLAPRPMPWQEYEAIPNTGMRKTIARRLLESKQTVPHFYLSANVELDAVLAVRRQLNEKEGATYKLSVNDFVVKAAALALRRIPAANAMWTDEQILRFKTVDVSVAVATEGGLLTPVIRSADQKGVETISSEVKRLAAAARAGKLNPDEYQGGGFTVSNLGMYGVDQFFAIINPPQSCILAVGAAESRPVIRESAVVARTMMTCTLSVDHRSVDGVVGAEFLAAFKAILEDPLQLLL